MPLCRAEIIFRHKPAIIVIISFNLTKDQYAIRLTSNNVYFIKSFPVISG